MSTNLARTLVWNTTMTSNCDVTNNAHQIRMTPFATEWTPPGKISAYAIDGKPIRSSSHPRPLHTSGFGRTLAKSIAFKTHCAL